MAKIIDSIRLKAGDQQRSVQWYQAQVQKLGSINTNKLMREGTLVNQVIPGYMYLFFYDAKYKETLPYYDRFPLVLPFKRAAGGFYGLNFHYLPYLFRLRILGYISEFASDEKMDENTRVRLSWNVINGAARLKPLKACVKHYLSDQVESRFLKIPFTDWVVASQLPVEKFVNAKKQDVWQDSRKYF